MLRTKVMRSGILVRPQDDDCRGVCENAALMNAGMNPKMTVGPPVWVVVRTELRREGVPHEGLRDPCQDEEADPAADAPPLLDHLVEQEDDHAGEEELEEDDYRLGAPERAQRAAQDVGP